MAETAIYPPAECVARVIVAAAKLVDANPVNVVAVRRHRGKTEFDTMRARVYAAQVIGELYPLCPKAAIDRAVGAWPGGNFLSNLKWRVEHGSLHWYEPKVVERLVAPEKAWGENASAPITVDLPFGSSGYVSLSPAPKNIKDSLLYEAVRNTK